MKCVKCSAENVAAAKFCAKCGAPMAQHRMAGGQIGYAALKEDYPGLYKESLTAYSYIKEKPYMVVDRVNTILETLMRKYYSEAIVNQFNFCKADLTAPKANDKVKKPFFEMIVEMECQGFITEEDAEQLKKINGTRNDIEYNGKGKDITSAFAKYAYDSGEKLSKTLSEGIAHHSATRYFPLKSRYPSLYQNAVDAEYAVKNGDALGTIQLLGKVLRTLCIELCAAYLPKGQTPEYNDASAFIQRNKLLDDECRETIKDIVSNRNLHHNYTEEISLEYAANAFDVSGKVVLFLLGRINVAPVQIALLVTENKIEYNKVMEYLVANVANLEDSQLSSLSLKISYNTFNCSSGLVDLGRDSNKKFAEKQTEYFLIFNSQMKRLNLNTQFEWLLSFEDYWRNTYPDISCTASVSPGGFVQTLTFDLEQLKNEPSLKKLLNTREKERELEKQKELFAQKVAERERQAWLKQRNRENRRDYLLIILVPVLYLAIQWIPIIPAWYTQPWIPRYVPPYLSFFLILSAVLVIVLFYLIQEEFGCVFGFIVVLMLIIIIPSIVTQSIAALFLWSVILDIWLLIEWIVYRVNC